MTDASGTVVWAADYKPFGEATITVSTITNNLRFPGQYFDAETGLHYNYFRDYDPAIGRYIEWDPIGLRGGINPYRYTGNNPVNFIDTTGLEPRTPANGPPNTTQSFPDGQGGRTDRTFGPDGQATRDIDYGHDHGAGDPHAHDWDWNQQRPRQPGRPPTPSEVPVPETPSTPWLRGLQPLLVPIPVLCTIFPELCMDPPPCS